MIGLVDRALALNPSFARGWYLSAGLMLRAGDPDAAIERLETALRLSPRARVGQMSTFLGVAHFLKRRFDEALRFLLRGIQERPTAPTSHRWLAACYAHLGRLAEAREIIQRVRTLTPAVVSHMPLVDKPDHLELFRSGLRLAAGEKT